MKLKGKYGSFEVAEGQIAYNAEAKAAFQKDSLAYLKALAKALGWAPMVYGPGRSKLSPHFNPGGIAVSGEATMSLQVPDEARGVYVMISCGGGHYGSRVSRSGAVIMWRSCTTDDVFGGHGTNTFEDWDLDSGELADKVLERLGVRVLA